MKSILLNKSDHFFFNWVLDFCGGERRKYRIGRKQRDKSSGCQAWKNKKHRTKQKRTKINTYKVENQKMRAGWNGHI
jgi:hypothetical protein